MTSQPLYTAHDVVDLFHVLPARFGFTPQESICAISTSGPRHRFGFSVRVDLPHDPDDVDLVAGVVAGHLQQHGAEGAVVLVLSDRVDVAERAARAVEDGLGPVRPVVTAWTDGRRCWTTADGDDPAGRHMSLDPHHPAVVTAVVAGQEILPDRASVAERWRPLAGPRRTWLERIVPTVELEVVRDLLLLERDEFARRGHAVVDGLLQEAHRGPLADGDLLRLCVWLTYDEVRDRVWGEVAAGEPGRDDARSDLALWRDVARRAPGPYAAVPYAVAACVSYLAGGGAEANMALEHATAADPGYAMAESLQSLLEGGVHPRVLRSVLLRTASPVAVGPRPA